MINKHPEGEAHSFEVSELTPDLIEEQAQEIATRALATIKPGENILTKPEEVSGVLTCEREIQREYAKIPGCSAFTTHDKLGNMPGNAYSLLMTGSVDEAVAYLNTVVADPVAHADEIDKADRIAKSALPESIKHAVLTIMLIEGDYAFQSQFQELLARIEETETRTQSDVYDVISTLSRDERYVSRQYDRVRTRAVEIVLEHLFPWMPKDPAYALLKNLWIKEDCTKEGVKKTIEKIVALAGDIPVDPNVLGEGKNFIKVPKTISGFSVLLDKGGDPFVSSPQEIASFVESILTHYCERRFRRAQNIHFLERYRDELLESQAMLKRGWILEETPRHKVGRIITEASLPIVTSDFLLDEAVYEKLFAAYQEIAVLMPKESEGPTMDEKLQHVITEMLPFIGEAIKALKEADTSQREI